MDNKYRKSNRLKKVTRRLTSKSKKKQHEMKQTTRRDWLDLPSDVMANILSRVGVIEILWNVQVVCTKWHAICKDPYVWRVIYIDEQFYKFHRPYIWPSCLPICAESMKATVETCKKAVDRSQGQLVDIALVGYCGEETLQYIVDRSSKLRRLEIAVSCYEGLATALKKLPLLEELSLYQVKLLQEDIEALGCYCPILKTLKLNDLGDGSLDGYKLAMAIVENLPELRHLELTWEFLCDNCLWAILDGCRHLQVLDLRMCEPVLLEGELWKRCLEQIKSLKLPTDPLKLDPYSDDDALVDLLSYKREFGWESDESSWESDESSWETDDNSTEDHITV